MDTNLSVQLTPVGQPWVTVSVGDQKITTQLTTTETFVFNLDLPAEPHKLTILHFNKAEEDPTTALVVDSISFFGITNPRFVWAGNYIPDYPKLWASQQQVSLPAVRPGCSYLGWNGKFVLEFDVPVFTWIHQTLNFGWIYN